MNGRRHDWGSGLERLGESESAGGREIPRIPGQASGICFAAVGQHGVVLGCLHSMHDEWRGRGANVVSGRKGQEGGHRGDLGRSNDGDHARTCRV